MYLYIYICIYVYLCVYIYTYVHLLNFIAHVQQKKHDHSSICTEMRHWAQFTKLYPDVKWRIVTPPACRVAGRRPSVRLRPLSPAFVQVPGTDSAKHVATWRYLTQDNHWLVVEPYPSEKWWSSSVGMMKFPTEWEKYSKCSKPPNRSVNISTICDN